MARFAHFNVWRAISEPPQDVPLAICDARSVAKHDLIRADAIFDTPGKAEWSFEGLVLAHASLVAEMTGIVPLLLLDEVVAHLDPNRRRALFGELAKLGAQVWLSGADPAAFTEIGASSEIFDVENGRIARRA